MKAFILLFSFALTLVTLSGCVQQPTTSEVAVDLRPAISFTPANKTQNTADFTIWVDNLAMGTADQYLTGKAALKLLTGAHKIALTRGNTIVFSETFYLGESAIKSIPLPQ
ncbi:hypothetical protein [Teredinibacter purpureus]|jgi:hypothetical protein|uniref:hypothetical protein n=1 Tax=Teredinibacter purpureus TaxID=2731756 RepID=UPI0005F77C3A|nr:hypothetical protein [Teredinibacter purpureus]